MSKHRTKHTYLWNISKPHMSICLAQEAWKITYLYSIESGWKKRSSMPCYIWCPVFKKNRRKSAVLYSPEACEESMIHSAMESHGDEEDNMQTISRATQVIRNSITNFTKVAKDTNAIEVKSDMTSWESISKPEHGDRPALLCWIPCKMATPIASWNQTWQMPFQLQRPSLRWLAINAKKTVLLPDVLAEQRTYPAPIFVTAAASVRMMRTHRTSMKLNMTMMVMMYKDSLVA